MSSPFQPYDGSVFFFQCESENPSEAIQSFVKSDPYVQKKIVEDFEIKEFVITDSSKDFERLTKNFLVRSWGFD